MWCEIEFRKADHQRLHTKVSMNIPILTYSTTNKSIFICISPTKFITLHQETIETIGDFKMHFTY